MRPVPIVSQRQYATASAQDTPSRARSAPRRFSSQPIGGSWRVASTNIAYSPTDTGFRAMAKTFTCSVRGGSPSSAYPAGTTTTTGSTIAANPTNSRGGVRARGSTRAGDALHPWGRWRGCAAVRTYRHEQHWLRGGQEREADLSATDAGCGGRAGLEYHERLQLLTFDRMRHADRGLVHYRMLREEGLLDFARIHVEALDADHFLFAVDDGDVSLRVDRRDVAGEKPAVADGLSGLV